MHESFYDSVPVTDGLAGQRTFLANERTLLAYVRTAFAMFVAGLTGAHLLEDRVLVAVGQVLAVTALVVLMVGFWRYRLSRRATVRMLQRLRETAQQREPS